MEDSAPTWVPSNLGACCLPPSWWGWRKVSSPRPPSEGRPLRAGSVKRLGAVCSEGAPPPWAELWLRPGVLPTLGGAAGTCA